MAARTKGDARAKPLGAGVRGVVDRTALDGLAVDGKGRSAQRERQRGAPLKSRRAGRADKGAALRLPSHTAELSRLARDREQGPAAHALQRCRRRGEPCPLRAAERLGGSLLGLGRRQSSPEPSSATVDATVGEAPQRLLNLDGTTAGTIPSRPPQRRIQLTLELVGAAVLGNWGGSGLNPTICPRWPVTGGGARMGRGGREHARRFMPSPLRFASVRTDRFVRQVPFRLPCRVNDMSAIGRRPPQLAAFLEGRRVRSVMEEAPAATWNQRRGRCARRPGEVATIGRGRGHIWSSGGRGWERPGRAMP
jgi:hypothetical protein